MLNATDFHSAVLATLFCQNPAEVNRITALPPISSEGTATGVRSSTYNSTHTTVHFLTAKRGTAQYSSDYMRKYFLLTEKYNGNTMV